MSIPLLLLLWITGVAFSQERALPASAFLTSQEIENLISAEEPTAAPYLISQSYGRPPGARAAIYTPFTRVALAANHARRLGKELKARDLPDWLTKPVVLVVFSSPCGSSEKCEYDGVQFDPVIPPTKVAIGKLVTEDEDIPTVEAISIIKDVEALNVLGNLPIDRPVLIAAFKPESIRPGVSVYAYWTLGNRTRVYSGGQIARHGLR